MDGVKISTDLIVKALADAVQSEGARAGLLLAAQRAVDVFYSQTPVHSNEMRKAIGELADAINRVRKL